MWPTVPVSHIVAGAPASLVWQSTDADGEPAEPSGVVTVGVTRSDGSVVVAEGSATVEESPSSRSVALSVEQTATVDLLTATWSVGSTVVGSTVHAVVGSPLLTLAELHRLWPVQGRKMVVSQFGPRREEARQWFADKLRRHMVPTLVVERAVAKGGKELALRYPDLREVRWAREVMADGTRRTVAGFAGILPSPDGVARLRDGVWPCGTVEVGYVAGWDRPDDDAKRVIARLIAHHESASTGNIDERAEFYSDGAGGTVRLSVEGRGSNVSSIPAVNEFVRSRRWRDWGVA
jgi:hypothetical protein